MQRVAKFMEQGARIVETQQGCFAGRRFGEITDVDDKRRDLAGERLLLAERGHPGAASL